MRLALHDFKHIHLTFEEIKVLVRVWDADNSGKVDYNEFTKGLKYSHKKLTEGKINRISSAKIKDAPFKPQGKSSTERGEIVHRNKGIIDDPLKFNPKAERPKIELIRNPARAARILPLKHRACRPHHRPKVKVPATTSPGKEKSTSASTRAPPRPHSRLWNRSGR